MKINLLLDNPRDVRSGYLNLDPFAPDNDQAGRTRGELTDLSEFVDGGEATEIVAHEILDYIPNGAVDQVLDNWLSRLAHGGTLAISVLDIKEISKAILDNNINILDTNALIYGEQKQEWQFRKSTFTVQLLAEVLANLGMKIIKKRSDNFRAIVVAQRP